MSNSPPTIISLSFEEASPYFIDQRVHIIADAADVNGDQILYKFFIKRTGAALWETLCDWQKENWISYKLDKLDYPSLQVKCQVRDDLHAPENSFDAEATATITISRASLISVTPSIASPVPNETTVSFVAVANKTANIRYRFWLKGPATANQWQDKTGWQRANSWAWRTLYCDTGLNQVKVQVVDDPQLWDDADTEGRELILDYTIT
ncbi:MAG: hypothetical protein A4E48_00023 [Methanosaeta sp. PtaU1.Bin060]|nr:hypothetical protein [Candidatus Methanosuratincola sp.]OPY55496.1 MAG: hypothetical protein A4E48_00023 [Methanosaeta sp. PtaU1.Bin060]